MCCTNLFDSIITALCERAVPFSPPSTSTATLSSPSGYNENENSSKNNSIRKSNIHFSKQARSGILNKLALEGVCTVLHALASRCVAAESNISSEEASSAADYIVATTVCTEERNGHGHISSGSSSIDEEEEQQLLWSRSNADNKGERMGGVSDYLQNIEVSTNDASHHHPHPYQPHNLQHVRLQDITSSRASPPSSPVGSIFDRGVGDESDQYGARLMGLYGDVEDRMRGQEQEQRHGSPHSVASSASSPVPSPSRLITAEVHLPSIICEQQIQPSSSSSSSTLHLEQQVDRWCSTEDEPNDLDHEVVEVKINNSSSNSSSINHNSQISGDVISSKIFNSNSYLGDGSESEREERSIAAASLLPTQNVKRSSAAGSRFQSVQINNHNNHNSNHNNYGGYQTTRAQTAEVI